MKRTKIEGCTLKYRESLNCSQYGNPKSYCKFETPDGEMIAGKTATDAACAYGIGNYDNGRRLATVEYHETRTGNIIFDYIYDTKMEG
jgi:hypothetical protein